MQSSNSLPTRSTLPPLVLSRSPPSPSFPSPPEPTQASIPFNKWREQNKDDKNQNKEDRNQNRKERFSQRSQRRLLSSSSSSSLPPSISPSPSLSPPQSADESNYYNDDYGEDENNNNIENELHANDLEPGPSRTRTNKNRSRLAEHTEIRQSDDSLFPPPPTSRIQQQQQIYGDVEVIEEDEREKERERDRERERERVVPPLFVSPIPREAHESVFVESATTGKFKKTDPNTIKAQNEKRDKLLSSSLSPSLSPSSSVVPLSRLFIVEKSFSFLQTIFTWLRGLLSGYGLCEVYLSVAFLREGNTELFLRVFGNTFGILHRSFLVLTVACLLSVFVKHVSLQPATPPDKAFTPAFSPSIRTSVSEQFMRNPKSTLVLCVCYIFVIISLLVDAKTTDMVEMAYKENRVVNVDLRRYFILNGIRGAAVILAWIVSIAVS